MEALREGIVNHLESVVDCRSLAVSNVLYADNTPLRADYCFALSGALDLMCVPTGKSSKLHIIISRNMTAEVDFLARLGYEAQVRESVSNDELAQQLDTGSRIIIDLDRFYIPLYIEKFGQKHFGAHCANLIAYKDADDGRYFLTYEFLQEEPVEHHDIILQEARFGMCPFMAPNGRTFIITGKPTVELSEEFIMHHLKVGAAKIKENLENCGWSKFLARFRSYIGNPMLETLLKKQLGFTCRSVRMSDEYGTAYRQMYTNALKQIAEDYNIDFLYSQVEAWQGITNQWVAAVDETINDQNTARVFQYWTSFLTEIIEKEQGSLDALIAF